jgi:N-glycosylase/DNA lyase
MQVHNFDLQRTILSRQIFRYNVHQYEGHDWFLINERDWFFLCRQEEQSLIILGTDEEFAQKFFRTKDNSPSFADHHLRKIQLQHQGLRLLRQDPWQCLVSFIIFQNSNIPRIATTIEKLSSTF